MTRLEGPETGLVIEGEFDLGWIGRLTPDQLAFVGALLRNRGNVQRLAVELGVSYNTARSRLDDVVTRLDGTAGQETHRPDRREILHRLAAGELTFEQAVAHLKGEERLPPD